MADTAAAAFQRAPDMVLLDRTGYIADRPNGTTAVGSTLAGHAFEVSFHLADPPAPSHLCVFFPAGEAARLLPGGGGGYHIAALRVPPLSRWSPAESSGYYYYHLYVLSSKTLAWSITPVYDHAGGKDEPPPHQTHKVISLGGSTLDFVDFKRGILCYDVLAVSSPEETPRLIRFPPPVGSNGRTRLENRAESIRDVTCVDGVIKFVEVENLRRMVLVRATRKCIPDVVHDSELEKLSGDSRTTSRAYADDGTMDSFSWVNDGWRVVTWSRQLSNSDHWVKCCDACCDDIVIGNPGHHLGLLLPELMAANNGGSGSEASLTKDLETAAPALSVDGGDVVYLTCKRDLQRMDQAGWLVGIDTKKKRVEHVAPVSTGRAATASPSAPSLSPYIPCAISKHMSLSQHDGVRRRPLERDHRPGLLAHGRPRCRGLEVTFQLAAPPARSHLCLRFPGRDDGTAAGGPVDAAVVCAEKDMAVVELQFRRRRCEYLVYKADPNHPSLDLIPPPYDTIYSPDDLGLLPGAASGGYHLAALRRHAPPRRQGSSEKSSDYSLYTRAWSVTALRSPWRPSSSHADGEDSSPPPHRTDKVIALGDSTVGFVDFRSGILCYDIILDGADGSPPAPRYIRFPPPVGGNGILMENLAASIRDVTCVDGVIKFVEVENVRRIVVVRGITKSIPDVLSDSDLEKLSATATSSRSTSTSRDVFDDDARDNFSWVNDGWRMVTWNRQVNSDHWIKRCDACADDIVVEAGNKGLLDRLPPELRTGSNGGGSGSEVTLNKNHVARAPALSAANGGDDVVYIMCRLELTDRAGWLLGIDTRKKRVEP
ncbi:unnamed protein product [Urochloa decumbens]|uniref:DUF1618 domain-containing protein n=1 Tax=Urochloa decumbens TaxID=240449 RepID=A0ABC9A579_9POAL